MVNGAVFPLGAAERDHLLDNLGKRVGFRPERAQAFLGSIRTWIDTHTDQVIIVVSLGLGLWLVGKSIYLIVT